MEAVSELLTSLKLGKWVSTFQEEELDLDLLTDMGVHLRGSLEELGMPATDIDTLEKAINKRSGKVVEEEEEEELQLEGNDDDDDDDGPLIEDNSDEEDDGPQIEDNPVDPDTPVILADGHKMPKNGYAPYDRRPRWLDGTLLSEKEEDPDPLSDLEQSDESDNDLDVHEDNVLYEVKANYQVIVDGIRVRALPNVGARVLDYKPKGAILATDAARNGWVRLRDRVHVRGNNLQHGWMLLDGEANGVGKLLRRVDKMQPLPKQKGKKKKDATPMSNLARHYKKWEDYEVEPDEDPRKWQPPQIPVHPDFLNISDEEAAKKAKAARDLNDVLSGKPLEEVFKEENEPPPSKPSAFDESNMNRPPPQTPGGKAGVIHPADFQAQREANLYAAKEMAAMNPADERDTMADVEMHNEHLLRDAKAQGKQGNVIYDSNTGRLVMMDEMACGGEADLYQWGQNNWEVLIKVYVMTDTKKKDVKLTTTTTTIYLEVDGLVMCEGKLHKQIIADETMYELSDNMDDGGRILTVTMRKMAETRGNQHWPCVIAGEAMIDVKQMGPPITTVSAYDVNEQKKAFGDDED